MRIIPAIDIIGGKCVRLSQGDYNTQKVYNESPVDVAKKYEDHGIKFLHLVDLDGAKTKHIVNHKVLESIVKNTKLSIDFGGGLKSNDDLRIAFECGAAQVTGGSIAVSDENTFLSWLDLYGNEKIILGADCLDRKIATHGWQSNSDIDVFSFIRSFEAKIKYVICTDISKDGMLDGPSFSLYQEIIENSSIQLIASGGITSIDDILALEKMGCEGAIIGKAIYEGKITLKELSTLC
jgi:phosphoribosylformimino-5-aminoimidazole carboxamide ribotide isomerase